MVCESKPGVLVSDNVTILNVALTEHRPGIECLEYDLLLDIIGDIDRCDILGVSVIEEVKKPLLYIWGNLFGLLNEQIQFFKERVFFEWECNALVIIGIKVYVVVGVERAQDLCAKELFKIYVEYLFSLKLLGLKDYKGKCRLGTVSQLTSE